MIEDNGDSARARMETECLALLPKRTMRHEIPELTAQCGQLIEVFLRLFVAKVKNGFELYAPFCPD